MPRPRRDNPDGTGKSPRPDQIALFHAALAVAALSGLLPGLATAHPVSPTRATAFVERETMTVAIEVFLEEERKIWFAERQKEQLGIADFSATYSFLYVDDFEVRHEILMPLKTLEEWLRLKRRDDAFLKVDEQEAAHGPVAELFTAGNPVEIDGIRVFSSLHKNVYRAFDCRREEQIYDALATSVNGDLLADLYIQIRQGLEIREQGGAISRVRAVKIVAGNLETADALDTADTRGFTYRCTWQVEDTVEHWGHIHTRRNEYEAFFAVELFDNQWKITQMKPLTEKRVKYRTGLRSS